jgi:hypothetical protein
MQRATKLTGGWYEKRKSAFTLIRKLIIEMVKSADIVTLQWLKQLCGTSPRKMSAINEAIPGHAVKVTSAAASSFTDAKVLDNIYELCASRRRSWIGCNVPTQGLHVQIRLTDNQPVLKMLRTC